MEFRGGCRANALDKSKFKAWARGRAKEEGGKKGKKNNGTFSNMMSFRLE